MKKTIAKISTSKFINEFFNENEDYTGIIALEEFIIYVVGGLYHRLDGPAVVYWDNSKYYYAFDVLHRLGGPAESFVNLKNNKRIERYSLYGKEISKEQHDFYYHVYLSSKKDYYDLMKFEGKKNAELFDNGL